MLASERRLLYVKKGSWELLWQVPLAAVASAEQAPTKPDVILRLKATAANGAGLDESEKVIECKTKAVVPLVLETTNQALEAAAKA